MVDVVTTAYTVIFIGILLVVGVVVFGTIADPMGDQWYPNESVITGALCSDPYPSNYCAGTVDNPPFEVTTRATPVVYNCTSAMASCQLMTVTTHYNYTAGSGQIYVVDDDYNGTIYVSYWSNTALVAADRAQQSITSTTYAGFEFAAIMAIVMAAAGIVGAIFLIGRRGT